MKTRAQNDTAPSSLSDDEHSHSQSLDISLCNLYRVYSIFYPRVSERYIGHEQPARSIFTAYDRQTIVMGSLLAQQIIRARAPRGSNRLVKASVAGHTMNPPPRSQLWTARRAQPMFWTGPPGRQPPPSNW